MTKRIVSRWLLLCAVGAGAAAVSPVYGQYMYSLVEQSGGSIWSVSALDVSLYDYADSAYVYAELSDPNGNNLDWGYDEEDSWNDYDAYAEVDLEGQVYLTGYFSVYADNYEWYLPIEDWLYLGPTTAGAYLNSGGGGPPVISNLSPPSAVYGESGYLEMDGTNFDPNGCNCVAGVWANNYSFGTVEWASDTVVTVYYSDTPPVGQNQIQIETQTGVDSNQMPFTINGDPTPSISGVGSPWVAGSTFELQITGSGFGNNQPATGSQPVTFSCCIDNSFFPDSWSDTLITGMLYVDPGAAGQNVTVTVGATGYGGQNFQPGQGQSNQGTATAGIIGPMLPVLTCTGSVTRGGTATCQVTYASQGDVSWQFVGRGATVAGPSGTLTWSGVMVVSGTVTATVAGYSGGPLNASVTVNARNWHLGPATPAEVPNGTIYALPTPPVQSQSDPPDPELGYFLETIAGGFTPPTAVQTGPNAGFLYVPSNAVTTTAQYEISPDLENQNSVFSLHQTGTYSANNTNGCIAWASELGGTQRHEYNSDNPALSHYGEYETSLNTNNPADFLEAQVAPPGTNATTFNSSLQTQALGLITQVGTDTHIEPLGLNYDANGNFLGRTNYAPSYNTCN